MFAVSINGMNKAVGAFICIRLLIEYKNMQYTAAVGPEHKEILTTACYKLSVKRDHE